MDAVMTVCGILMCCDESIIDLAFGRGYKIRKIAFEELPFKDKVTNGQGSLSIDYFGSRLFEDGKLFFMCIERETTIQLVGPQFTGGMQVFTDKDLLCQEEISQRTNEEMKYLNRIINLLRLFKPGNIGFFEVFFTFRFKSLGIINNTVNNSSCNKTRNTLDARRFTLTDQEVDPCNGFIADYINAPYTLLENSINEFSWGLEQVDIATGFEQYTTALEMILLGQNQAGKKQALANRVAALIGKDQTEITMLYKKMTEFYRYRSESLHEGDGTNISKAELEDMEEIVRRVINACLQCCKLELASNPSITWETVKSGLIGRLKNKVLVLKTQGVLPA